LLKLSQWLVVSNSSPREVSANEPYRNIMQSGHAATFARTGSIELDNEIGAAFSSIVTIVSTWGIRVLGAIAVLIIGRIVAGSARATTRKALERANLDATLVPFLASLVYYVIITLVVIAVLNLFGIETTSLIAVVGAAGLAIGLAMQGTLSNVASGVMLLVFRPFRIGDFVEIGGTAGSVAEIGLFSTTLNTGDNVRITVPNSSVYGEIIKNFSANDTRRNDMLIGVSYDDDIGKAIEVITSILAADSRVLKEPAALVAVTNLGDSSVDIVVRPWCAKGDYWPLRFDLNRAFKEQLEAAGCSIPYPQSDVHIVEQAAAGGS
jgi:small conductance mechanosensitive channel